MSATRPGPFDLATTFLRLRNDASVEPLPVDDTFWPRIMSGALGTFHHEYLVALFAYDQSHTARPHTHCRMLFITPGEGTQHRPAAAASG